MNQFLHAFRFTHSPFPVLSIFHSLILSNRSSSFNLPFTHSLQSFQFFQSSIHSFSPVVRISLLFQDSNLLATSSQFFLFFFGMASGSQDEDILEVPSETEVDGMALTQMHKESGLSTPAQPGDCCLDCCLAAFEENAALKTRVNEIKASLNGSTLAEKNAIVFEVLKTWLAHHGFAEARGHRVFLAWNIPLCVKATCEILQVSRQKLQKLKSWILEGHSNPPQDGRSLVVKATSSEALACHMILSWASRP